MKYSSIILSRQEAWLRIIINRPKALNALNKAVFDDLDQAIAEIESDSSIRAVSIEGSGDKAFAAGADITEFQSLDEESTVALSRKGQRIMQRLQDLRVPVFALIKGYALGGGLELALACHCRVANVSAKFGLPEINLGLMPGYGGTVRMSNLIGTTKAMYHTLTGDMLDAEAAHHAGLIAKVIPDEDFEEQTAKMMRKLAAKAPIAASAIIQALKPGYTASEDAMAYESKEFGRLMMTQDAQEGASAFVEKRKPIFTGN